MSARLSSSGWRPTGPATELRLKTSTHVAQPLRSVFPVFGDAAFVESLAPAWMGLQVLQIGLRVGDEIRVRFTGLGPPGDWVSRIERLERSTHEIWFVDRSVETPWPLAEFVHHHRFLRRGRGTVIVDDATYSTSPPLLGLPVWPFLQASFAYRSDAYRRRFGAAR